MRGNWDGHGFSTGTGRGGWYPGPPDWKARTKLDRWREENPGFRKSWQTAHGVVNQLDGKRVYFGECRDCYNEIVCVRDITGRSAKYLYGQTQLGRWPILCDDCRKAVEERRRDRNRKYAANYRRKVKARMGPGNLSDSTMRRRREAEKREEELQEHFGLYHYFDDDEGCYDDDCPYRKPDQC